MNDSYDQWKNVFMGYMEQELYDQAVDSLTTSFEIVFSTASLNHIYEEVSKIPKQYFKTNFSKLLLGWLSFANGDNKKANWVIHSIDNNDLEKSNNRSMYYSLKAMLEFVASPEDSLNLARLAVDVLQDRENMVAANAYMTYARHLTNAKKYRDGAEHFKKAYAIFEKVESHFLWLNCFVSECLNLYALGECKEIIKKCQKAMVMNSSQNTNIPTYMKIIKLPMGMCYYEMNKIDLAIEALNAAKSGISDLKLIHMHGLVETYLFECYRIKKDGTQMKRIIEELDDLFQNLPYPQIKYLILSMQVKRALMLNEEPNQEWIDELELAYGLEKLTPTYIVETLLQLKQKGYSKLLTKERLIEIIEQLRFSGHVPDMQLISLYIADLFYLEKDMDACKYHLKTACDIYSDHDMFSSFLRCQVGCFIYLNDIKPSIIEQLRIYNSDSTQSTKVDPLIEKLTNREREILELIAIGKSNQEISELLFISLGTTKWHINHIFSKLSVKKRFHAIEKAKQYHLI